VTPVEALSYRDAMKEVQGIVDRLKRPEMEGGVDVDELVTDVTRAKELLDHCGRKVQQADMQISNVIEALKRVEKAEVSEVASVVQDPEPFEPGSDDAIPF
jgi:exodeoxyribonuclease VII small subunit